MTEHKPVTPYGVDIYDEPIHVVWWKVHENIVTLVHYMASNGASGHEVAYAVEKPWHHEAQFDEAVAAQEEEAKRDEARARRNTLDEKGQPYR